MSNLSKHFPICTPSFDLELKALLILTLARIGINQHLVIDRNVHKYLARALFPYFTLCDKKYSDEIIKVSKILLNLLPSIRAHFFDILDHDRNKNYILDRTTFYLTREFGIDEKKVLVY